MKTSVTGIFIVAALALAACKKDNSGNLLSDGTYSGQLIASSTLPSANSAPLIGNVSITLKGNTFTSAYGTPGIAAGGRGSFVVSSNIVTFRDSTVHPANFDWGLILNGDYTHNFKGDSLFLVKSGVYSLYTYKLKKN